jgi:hypothetical protein
LGKILDYLCARGFSLEQGPSRAVNILERAINPHKSGTFRKGKPGNWREHFSEENKSTFKDYTGDLLKLLGYEGDNDW